MRYTSIDLLRTVAIILMVVVHFLENLSGVDWAPAGFGAPLFGFLVGVSYRIWLQGQLARGRSDEQITRSTLRRGCLIFLIGLVFNVVVWLPGDLFNWDVLTLIGTAVVVLGLIRELPSPVTLLLAALIFLTSPLLRAHSDYADYWTEGYYDPDWTIPQLALGYLVNGYFPVFPWLYFPLIGYVAGERILPPAEGETEGSWLTWQRLQPLAWIGLGFVALWAGLRLTRPYQQGPQAGMLLGGWTMFPASVEYLTGITGGVLIAFALLAWWVDGRGGLARFPVVRSVTRTMSQHSFSIYVLHHVVHVWPLWLYGVATGQEATYYWRQAMPWPVALALVPLCLLVCYLLFSWVDRRNWPSLESLLRRLSD